MPGVLIIQIKVKPDVRMDILEKILGSRKNIAANEQVVDFPTANLFASALDEDGRVFPIVWSLVDPGFRVAVEENKVRGSIENPSLNDAFDSMRGLRADYVLTIVAWHEADSLMASATLYSGRNQVWRDQRSVSAVIGGSADDETAASSLCRTWTALLGGGPFKNLPQKRLRNTPDPEQGLKPAVADNAFVAPKTGDTREVLAEAAKRMSAGQGASAVNLLRDAIDREPLDPERRVALVNALIQLGEPLVAAIEARQAAELMPDKIEIRIAAARAWIAAGKGAEALVDLNVAIAHDAESPQVRLLLGELQLAEMKLSFAIEHFDKAIGKAPSAEAHFMRGVARMAAGDAEGAKKDFDEARKLEPNPQPSELVRRYRIAIRIVQGLSAVAGNGVRSVIPRARLRPSDADVKAEVDAEDARVRACLALLDTLNPPEAHKPSHERRQLALKLLLQTLSDVKAHQSSPNEEALSEATITLGEALKQIQAAAAAFDRETAQASGG